MLRSRIIPCLLIHNKGLVKTINFKNPKYIGDPINAVKIFNEKEVDELIVLDIDATHDRRGPDFETIKKLAVECRMPFCYGGGITSADEARHIINLGAEKVAISSAAIKQPDLIYKIGAEIGVQSVVVVLDVKKKGLFKKDYEIVLNNGLVSTGINVRNFVSTLSGVGEIVINSVDNDGVMRGYDYELIDMVRNVTDAPITVIGGAGSLADIQKLIANYKIIGAGAGSLFVFVGKYRAVLINYPSCDEKLKILKGVL